MRSFLIIATGKYTNAAKWCKFDFNGITAIGGGGAGTYGCGRGARGDFASYPSTYDQLSVGQLGGSGGGGGYIPLTVLIISALYLC